MTITNPIPNVALIDAPQGAQGNSNANRNDNRGDRDDFASLVSRANNNTFARDASFRDSADRAATADAREEASRAAEVRSENARTDNSKDKDDVAHATNKTDADDVRGPAEKPEHAKADNSKGDNTKADTKADSKTDTKTDRAEDKSEGKGRVADAAFILTANELLDSDVVDDTALPVGGSLTPDVTAILTEASSVQTAGDTDILTAATQPMGLLALAAQIEKAMAALEAQKLAAGQKTAATASTNLTILSAPVSPVMTDEAVTDTAMLGEVTPLVDVLGEQEVQLPGQVKPVAAPAVDIESKVDAIMNAVKQAAQPVAADAQLQLKIVSEEVIDPADAMQQVLKSEEGTKMIQKYLVQSGEEGKKSPEDLMATLKQLLADRGQKDNTVQPFGQTVSQAIHAVLDVSTPGQDDFASLNQNGNQQLMSQLAADALRHGNANALRNDSSFLNMLDKTTNHVPVHDQVMVNIKQAVADGASHIKIQLHPEDLGRVDVRMSVGLDGKTSMTIMADNRDTLDMLQREAGKLERSLTDLGLKPDTGGLSFHLRQQNQQQEQRFTKTGTSYASVAAVEADEPALMTNMAAYRLTVNEGVDIRV